MQNYGIILKYQRKFIYEIFKNGKKTYIVEKWNIHHSFSTMMRVTFSLFSETYNGFFTPVGINR